MKVNNLSIKESNLERETKIDRVKSRDVSMDEAIQRFGLEINNYYNSFSLKPTTVREKILVMQQFIGEGNGNGGFHSYGNRETHKFELKILEFLFLYKKGFVY